MGEVTKISWCHATFNPWRGCTKVSAGCANCYAETMSKRNPAVLGEWGPAGTRAMAAESYWRLPLAWDRAAEAAGERRRVFCASLADVFEERPDLGAPRARLFDLMAVTPNLDWLLLTKRPENIAKLWPGTTVRNRPMLDVGGHQVFPNVWLGVSVEDQKTADERIPLLLETPAAVRFVSYEPALGPVDLSGFLSGSGFVHEDEAHTRKPFSLAFVNGEPGHDPWLPSLSWIIVGGESGPKARPFDVAWARSVVEQCRIAGVPCFVKQDSGPCSGLRGRIPDDLWVKEFPRVA